ncbi:TonB-dependent siderophore receptor [Janthinobacterium sp. Mn2066]|uniref:TonB-dependent siderophore receptor n=1 Tax=Janthinobacterium sp. Mn2066 TaxID=3395264 RepID=UPI003BE63730
MQHRFQSAPFNPTLSRPAAAVRAVVLGLALPASTVPALAQSQASVQTTEARNNFNLPAGPLGQVLNSFATTAGIELTVDTALLQGKSSKGLSGSYSVREGFAELLRGHPLHAVQQANGSYTVSRLSQQGEVVMPGVTVQAQQGGATQAYAGGHVATGGRVGLLGSKDFMETPFNTVSYTERFIEDRQARDITDVISAVDPTVFSTGMTGTINENFSIRGFSSSISDVTVNGLFGISPYYRTSPEMFERIEVLKGPSALLNGMPPGGSVGGSVNLVPKRAGDEPLTRAALSYLSDSQWGGHVDIGRRFGDNKQFGARFNGVYRNGNGSVDHQKKETQLASLGLDWRGDGARVSADLYQSDDRTDGLNRGINLAPGIGVPRLPKPDTLLNPSWAFYDTRDKGVMLRGELDLNESVMAYVAMGASQTDYHSTGAYLIQVFNTAGDYRTNLADLAFEVDRRSAEIGFKGKFRTGDIGHQWAVNATHYNHTDKQYGRRNVLAKDWITNLYNPVWGPASTFNAPQISRAELRLASVGLADTLSFMQDKLQWTVGVRRQDVVSDTFNVATGARTARYEQSATSPATALLFKLTPQLSVYGNYIEGLSQGSTAPMTAANAGEVFPPFKTRQKEVGLKFDLGDFAHTASLYEIKRPSSYIDPVTNVFSVGGEQRNRGVEWSFFGTPMSAVRLMGGVAYVDPRLTQTAGAVNQGKQATGVPKLQAKLGAEWDAPTVPGLTLSANATTASKQYINAGNTLWVPGRTVFDLGGRYATTISSQPLTLRANITNVSNKAYWAMPQLTSLGLGAPRTVQISATMDF